ncbi:UPF0187-domain-containing protein [Rhodofomes roseus]|uniref:UPF0187-domain-containing protein n=1 Tax=Rhodofomes roseus TaxID=34475 RepID=A0ABQ8K2H2_9APHY|nr:UPF0187-domain-containing protein [Rhodofomes roseus]KAH9830920.1 UPF0187-domain-containing protein [Rhodofomes roseus]
MASDEAEVTTASVSGKGGTVKFQKTKIISRQRLRKYSWLPDVLRLKGSIVPRIIGPVLTVTIFASIAAYLWDQGTEVTLTNQVVPLLSVVVGLILVFRNGTSYDRYYEGRKDFGTMTAHIRSLSRSIWINVAVPPADDAARVKGVAPNLTAAQLRRRKVDALKLCAAYAYSVKHYLRGEDGLDWEDYVGVLPASTAQLARYGVPTRRTSAAVSYAATARTSPGGFLTPDEANSPSNLGDAEGRSPSADATKRIRVKRSKDKLKQASTRTARTPLLSERALHQTIDFHPHPETLSTPLPLVIAHELSRLLFFFKRDGYLETVGPAGTNALSAHIHTMVEMMTAMERVANTPIPRSYSIHLKQCVTLYLFVLPFTLIKDLGWGMVPIVTVVAFTLMGIEGIADEIEMPFGLDKSDLPLERYCDDLKEEIEYIVERLPEGGEGMYGTDDGEGDD